jgi:hypothetical protein
MGEITQYCYISSFLNCVDMSVICKLRFLSTQIKAFEIN